MRRLTTTQKLWASLGLIWLAMLLMVGWGAWENRQTMLEERRAGLEVYIDLAMAVIEEQAERAEAGEISTEQAKQRAAEIIKGMSYHEGRGYFYAFNGDLVMLSHPRLPEGTSVADFQNVEERYLFREFAKDVVEDDGFVDYLWAHEEGSEPAPKSSYHARFDDWGWIVGTGVYIDDIDAAFVASLSRSLLALLVIGVPVSLMMMLVIRGITRGLGGDPRYAVEVARSIADGDLSRAVRLRDGDQGSLLFDIERMRQALSTTIGNIRGDVDAVSGVVDEIDAGNDELATRTEQQASALTETASSMEELTTTVRHNAEHAEQARNLSGETASNAARGRAAMEDVVAAIDEINDSASQMNGIVDTIDSIAFQTNILALNASVEAARAGEHGRGFAVVAEEVRQLASRSASATREIKTLIERSDSKVVEGTRRVKETDEIIAGMAADIQQLTALVGEISTATREQSQGIEQVGEAVTQMDQMTQQNAGLVEGHSDASRRLVERSHRLRERVARFRIAVERGEYGAPDAEGASHRASSPEPAETC
ncbi:methyl-accepting chemotaxis protein [Halomonas elongata]|uniref:Methyl-accepting chemotaxis protein n=2 Tax=Halomonas elongata TaxID=2746 RepID=E1VBR7_HALED|nr:methyl-accepting chemotaxis protein [Halomonas elongata]MDL4860895.1 methyl-accepting chemotaxis protein [Halomonas elongata]WBF17989.1 methyl-accepting chemotaxis protein [Halomonas elongata]WPU46838.1 methyl-accepting chemotaxis protein [Halomonas elongata DSM 2581]WVI71556.1 methyl-accepting chemotaxis protein [Halomonas elongata]CBV44224.1 methyl-accepting chemotaxis sensory transducer [Halomonas elongata DSM 2581]